MMFFEELVWSSWYAANASWMVPLKRSAYAFIFGGVSQPAFDPVFGEVFIKCRLKRAVIVRQDGGR
jgi:hypothetical protein